MTKHPVIWATCIAAGLSLALAVAVLAIYPAQQVPWALAAVMLAFPFLFLFAWLVVNGVAWWNAATGVSGERSRDDESV